MPVIEDPFSHLKSFLVVMRQRLAKTALNQDFLSCMPASSGPFRNGQRNNLVCSVQQWVLFLTDIYCSLDEVRSGSDNEDEDEDEDEDDDPKHSKKAGPRKKGEKKTLITLEESKSGHAIIPTFDDTPTRTILEGVIRSVVTHGYHMIHLVF